MIQTAIVQGPIIQGPIIQDWIAHEIVQRFAGSLLHFLWQGAVVALLAAVCLKLMARRSAELRYAVSIAALAAMVAAPVLTFVFYAQTGAIALKLLQWTARILADSGVTHAAGQETVAWTRWIVTAWGAGVSICVTRLLIGWRLSRLLIPDSRTISSATVTRMFGEIKHRLALTGTIRVLINSRIDTPMAIGWIRPAVLLPVSAVTGLNEDHLRAILAHELAHIRRHDFLVNILQRCVESMLFYHPGVWWLSARIRAERENCCDDLAVQICGNRQIYARALVELERKRISAPALAVAATGGSLVQRIQRILGLRAAGPDWQSAIATLLFVVTWMAAGMWQSTGLRALPLQPPPPAALPSFVAAPANAAPSPVASALNAIAAIATAQPVLPEVTAPAETEQTGLQVLKGAIQGVVTRTGTSEPIANAQITIAGNVESNAPAYGALWSALAPLGIQRAQQNRLPEDRLIRNLTNTSQARGVPVLDLDFMAALKNFRAATAQFKATTDRDGRFTIRDVPPGKYTIRAEHESYFGNSGASVNAPIAAATVNVSGGSNNSIALSMSRGSTIGGRVRDGFDRPLANAFVQAFWIAYQDGFPVLQAATTDTTDDRGQFRLFWLPPGEYFVAVTLREPGTEALDAGALSLTGEQSSRTYYPGTLDVTRATPFLVKAGENVEGVSFAIRNARLARLSGVVNSTVPHSSFMAVMMLMLRDDSIPDNTGERVVGRVDLNPYSGKFEISGVAPGSYDLYARIPDSNPGKSTNGVTFGRIPIDVRNEDVSGLAIDVHPTVSVKGTVRANGALPAGARIRFGAQVEGSAAKIPFYQLNVARRMTPAGTDGSFTLPAVPVGHYRIVADGLPANMYISDVRQGGGSVFDAGFDVGAESPIPLEVILSSGAAAIQGSVRDLAGNPASGATVVVVPPPSRRQNWALYSAATTDASGHFSIQGVIPGDYRVLAWESLESGAYYNPRFLASYESNGRPVHLTSASTVHADVIAIQEPR